MKNAGTCRSLAAAICCACLLFACSGNSLEDLRSEGQKLLKEGNAGGAVVFFKNALEKDPADFSSRLNLAKAYVKLGKLPQADDELQKCLRQKPDDRELNMELAMLYLAENKLEKALVHVRKAEEAGQPDAASRELAGIAYSLLKQHTEAEAALKASLELEPKRESATLALARLYLAIREPEKALELADRALAENPDSLNAIFLRAELAMRMNDLERAVKLYSLVTQLAPRNGDARYMLGSLYLRLGEDGKALVELERMRENMSGDARLFMLEGLYAYQTGKYAEAAGYFQNSVNAFPTIDGYYRLGLALHRSGNQESAVSQLRKVLDVVPAHAAALKLMTAVLIEQGRAEEARAEAELLTKHYPGDAAAHHLLGMALSAAGENSKALEELKRAAELDPGMPEALLRRGSILVAEGRYGEAGRDLALAVTRNADNIAARRALFQFHMGRRHFAEAEAVVEEGLKRKPESASLLTMKAMLLTGRGNTDEALAVVKKAREIDRDFPESLDLELKLLLQTGRRAEALQCCLDYLSRHPESTSLMITAAALSDMDGQRDEAANLLRMAYTHGDRRALFILARRAVDDKHPEQAEEMLKKDLAESPTPVTREFLAGLYLSQNKPEAAMELYNSLEKKDPSGATLGKFRLFMALGRSDEALVEAKNMETLDSSSPLGALCAAEILEKSGRPDEALKELEQTYRRLKSVDLLMAMAELSLRRKDVDKADAYYQTALLQEPENPRALSGKGMTLMLRRNYAEASEYYERARRGAPGNAEISNNLAMAYAESGQKPEQALRMAISAFMLSPDNPRVIDTMGLCLLHAGRADEAVNFLHDSLKNHPSSAQLHYRLGEALLSTGKSDEARQILRKSLELGEFADSTKARKLLEAKP